MPSDYVYQGIWSKWDGYPWNLTLTATNITAIIIMMPVAALLAATQSRMWVFIRNLLLGRHHRLSDDLESLSQVDAVTVIGTYLRSRFMQSRYNQKHAQQMDYKLRLSLGFCATLNGLTFIFLSGLLPWLLTDGALGAPEVRSRRTDSCQEPFSEKVLGSSYYSNILLAVSSWQQCYGEKNAGSYCDPNIVRGAYVTSTEPGCIFPSSICLKDQPTATFTRANMTAHDLGLNSKSKMMVSHRLSCSPISLDSFISRSEWSESADSTYGNFTLSIQDPRSHKIQPSNIHGLNMWTDNNLTSGQEMFDRKSSFTIWSLPDVMFDNTLRFRDYIHPLLRFSDAETFILVLKAGYTWYRSMDPIVDPLFQVTRLHLPDDTFLPSREATGIGCKEQTQVCVHYSSGLKCYPWVRELKDVTQNFLADLRQLRFQNIDALNDDITVFWKNFEYGPQSVQYFIGEYFNEPNPLLARRNRVSADGFGVITGIDAKRQWIYELAALFNKARIFQKLNTLAIVRNDVQADLDRNNSTPQSVQQYPLCDMILFIDLTTQTSTGKGP